MLLLVTYLVLSVAQLYALGSALSIMLFVRFYQSLTMKLIFNITKLDSLVWFG
ncbi:hypothetical protein VCRA2122O339_160075 [Vibrio crassostreae]|nr:hypothetical protein VCRA2120E331_160075 [Vibrio crassostreae]CAK3234919.1 hypothetical protein VCRA2127O345_160065 [Vibrio crassostreae]CAK3260369.1 hypothetical protein VCRA2120E330_170074 [Vibrio crassostreae]CAK3270823.1 hypothetical protein VCRA2122O339_160075 [Vibrio crassostreae]CAK3274509.1 hypothetical protein VCRA2122O338_160076 [Vibrio crassostreae]